MNTTPNFHFIQQDIWRMLSNIVYENSQPRNLIDLEEKVTNAVDKINMHKRHVSLYCKMKFFFKVDILTNKLQNIILCKIIILIVMYLKENILL